VSAESRREASNEGREEVAIEIFSNLFGRVALFVLDDFVCVGEGSADESTEEDPLVVDVLVSRDATGKVVLGEGRGSLDRVGSRSGTKDLLDGVEKPLEGSVGELVEEDGVAVGLATQLVEELVDARREGGVEAKRENLIGGVIFFADVSHVEVVSCPPSWIGRGAI